jgi:translation initiation factor IF-2
MAERQKDVSGTTKPKLEIVLKCDSAGSLEAVTHALSELGLPGVDITLIHHGLGAVSKSDVLLAETASRLIVGFQVDVLPGMGKVLREHRVEVRLYQVIYELTDDIKAIAEGMIPPVPQEQIIGSAKVIALFKSTRKGIIIGCRVLDGFLSVGHRFRIISAIGPMYTGTIESLHIGQSVVQKATPGSEVGIQDFNKAHIGDLVESFRAVPLKVRPWVPQGQVIRKEQQK